MDTTFADRIRTFRKHKGLSQQAFADQCGLDQGNITQMERGTDPKSGNTSKILLGFPDLSGDWLLTGAGSMLKNGQELTPFVAGGQAGPLGSTVLPRGGLSAALGSDFGEDVDGKANPAPAPTDAKGFIKLLLAEIEALKSTVKDRDQVIAEQRDALKESRENAQFLRAQLTLLAKTEGNHFAPDNSEARPGATGPTQIHGLRRYGAPQPVGGVVRALYPARPRVELRMAS